MRSVGSVAGGIDGTACTGRAAALLLHNPADRAVPISESLRARDALLGDAAAVPRPSTRQPGAFLARSTRYPRGRSCGVPLTTASHGPGATILTNGPPGLAGNHPLLSRIG